MAKIFVDGQEGTTGLKIFERLKERPELTLIQIDPERRKDPAARADCINQADVAFLCLPDAAAREAVQLCENPDTVIIDASTAHRTAAGWAYGIPELSPAHRASLQRAKRIANPGCYASGFIVPVYPLVQSGVIAPDCPLTVNALSGYSGGGKKMIAQYEAQPRAAKLDAPRAYGLTLAHKHLPEMAAVTGLTHKPLFIPTVAGFYQGMTVSIPLPRQLMARDMDADGVRALLAEHYAGEPFIRVMEAGTDGLDGGFMDAQACNGTNRMDLFVFGYEELVLIVSRLDNLGKGASGAAVQCMNLALGVEETRGLKAQ